MKNLKKVAERIKRAVKDNEKIVLFSDADLDGVTSAVILEESIEKIGGKATVYTSDRERWGYGLSKEAVVGMKEEAPALLISLDCGISNFEGATEAKRRGFELVIVDHHKTLSKLPDVSLILDPLQKGDTYPFKKLANAGVVYKLAQEILGESFSEQKRRFLELTALATVADMVPKEEDNKKILDEGLGLLENSSITSLRTLREKTEGSFVDKLVALLNVTDAQGKVNDAYLFFKTEDEEVIKEIIERVEQKGKKRKEKIEKEEQLIMDEIQGEEKIIFKEGRFPSYLSGSVASKIIRKHKKPVFIYAVEDGIACGSVRVVTGQDSVEAMSSCAKYLDAFGGHAMAAGFTLETKNLKNFEKCLVQYFEKEKS